MRFSKSPSAYAMSTQPPVRSLCTVPAHLVRVRVRVRVKVRGRVRVRVS